MKWLLLLLCLCFSSIAHAQDEDSNKVRARELFFQGFELQRSGDCAGALANFQRSRELYPTKNATNNAAICLVRLKRLPEALVMFETLLREFPTLSDDDRAEVLKEVQRLRARVGSLVIDGPPLGAQVVVNGRTVGNAPLLDPIRVNAGSAEISVYKEGYAPFAKRVDVAGGETQAIDAKLESLAASGALTVNERGGGVVDVIVDGTVVGTTPWRGRLPIGEHVVQLRGKGDLGSEPARIEVSANKAASLTLNTEPLKSSLLVEVSPPGSRIFIDAIEVGAGAWQGRLKSGPHRIEAVLAGFTTLRRDVDLAEGVETLKLTLERDPDAELWKEPNKVVFDVAVGFAVGPTLGGDIAGSCDGDCTAGPPLGFVGHAFVGYELGSGWSFGALGGYMFVEQQVEERTVQLTPQGLTPHTGVADETLQMTGGLVAFAGGYHFGSYPTVLLRLGAGVMFASVGAQRKATFQTADADFVAPDITASALTPLFVAVPEARVALPVGNGFEVGAKLSPFIMIPLSTPRWNESGDRVVVHPSDGVSTYSDETLIGSAFVVFAPGVFARYQL